MRSRPSMLGLVVTILSLTGLSLLIGAAAGAAPSPQEFVTLQDIPQIATVDAECGGEVAPIIGEGNREVERWAVECQQINTQRIFESSLVGHPVSGYAALSDQHAPRQTLRYSEWIYSTADEASAAVARWERYFAALGGSGTTTPDTETNLSVRGINSSGLPFWGKLQSVDRKLLVVELQSWPAETNYPNGVPDAVSAWQLTQMQPEDAVASEKYFQDVYKVLAARYLNLP